MKSESPTPLSQQLIRDLRDARKRELEVLSGLTPRQMVGGEHRITEPPIWEMGHVGWFQEFWTSRRLDGKDPLRPEADDLYNSFNIPNSDRWELAFPSFKETLAYITDVLDRTVTRLEQGDITDEDVYFTRLAINHEDMHSETMVHIRQTLGYTPPEIADTRRTPVPVQTDYDPHDVRIPGGIYMLGADPAVSYDIHERGFGETHDPHPERSPALNASEGRAQSKGTAEGAALSGVEGRFVFDNEKWAHPVKIKPFAISSTPVTQADFQRFVEAGGYQERSIWSDEGWAWREDAGAVQPVFWKKGPDGRWLRRVFTEWQPVDPFLPMVHVNWFEANAYARWAGRRLPTEAEWELAASSTPSADGKLFTAEKRWYPWGDEAPDEQRANLDSAAQGLVDVRAFPDSDSAWGLRQMIGNVWEWTASTFQAYPGYVIDPYDTYSEPSFGEQKVLRGGCWVTRGRVTRNTFRNFYTPDRNNIYAGFRTAVDL